MDLLLWRHAEAEDSIPDLERRLTARGHRQAQTVAAWLLPRLPAEFTLLVSPARRARETAAALGGTELAIEPRLAPGTSVAAVLEVIAAQERNRASATLVLVGHQPWVGQIAAQLLSGQPHPWGVRKAAVWWLTHHGAGQWSVRAVMDRDLID
jgi:phosphohistidine phosphatase